MQMMQQLTGINFIFYFGTVFFQSLGTISNPFLISLITTLVNVCPTPLSFYMVEAFGRRRILIWGALGMITAQFIVGIIRMLSTTSSASNPTTNLAYGPKARHSIEYLDGLHNLSGSACSSMTISPARLIPSSPVRPISCAKVE
jgi:MFS family permease